MTDPFDINLQREAIDAHKADRMADPYKRHAFDNLSMDSCVRFWIEQIGDAEKYQERWHELKEATHE